MSERSMVELVARAHFEARDINFSHPRLGMRSASWDELPPYAKQRELNAARAALEAMRGPTPRMEQEFVRVMGEGKYPSGQGFAPAWGSAIDAALSESGDAG